MRCLAHLSSITLDIKDIVCDLEMFGENAEALREITKMMCGRKS
jgi:hypothetical protein